MAWRNPGITRDHRHSQSAASAAGVRSLYSFRGDTMKSATSSLVREEEIRAFAQRLRIQSVRMTNRAHSSHIGSCLSIADILAVLYADVLRVDAKRPQWSGRDRLIVSKGHAAAVT